MTKDMQNKHIDPQNVEQDGGEAYCDCVSADPSDCVSLRTGLVHDDVVCECRCHSGHDVRGKRRYSVEKPLQVWDDNTGERIEVGHDRDGLALVEVRAYDAHGNVTQEVVMPAEVWRLLREWEPASGGAS